MCSATLHPSIHPSFSSIHLCLPFPFTPPLILLRMTDSPSKLRPLIMIMLVFIYLFFLSCVAHRQYLGAELKIRTHNVCSVSLMRLSLLYGRFHITTCIWAPSRLCRQTFFGLLSNITDLSFSVFTLIRHTVGLLWNWSEAKTSRYRLG